jgi:hypothetical protein
MLPTPIGYMTLLEAIEAVGQKIANREDVVRRIAEACESGSIKAVYRSDTGGADDLDTRVWQMPQRRMFEIGMIELDLPLHDNNGRPHPQGFTAKCEREIFLRRDKLEHFVASLAIPIAKAKHQAGAPEQFDWEAIRQFTFSELTNRGDFAEKDQVKGWKAAADLYRSIETRFPEGECPSLTSLKERVPLIVEEWRASQGR